jgi:hypothetical protein
VQADSQGKGGHLILATSIGTDRNSFCNAREIIMIQVKPIAREAEIEGAQRFVLVQLGQRNATIRHGNGVTITIDKNQSLELREMNVSLAIDDAREIAMKEGLPTIFTMV